MQTLVMLHDGPFNGLMLHKNFPDPLPKMIRVATPEGQESRAEVLVQTYVLVDAEPFAVRPHARLFASYRHVGERLSSGLLVDLWT